MNTEKPTTQAVNEMSYTDFIGTVNQWNVPPGAYGTLSKWAQFGRIDQQSKVLEIACSTGFSSRELAEMTGCTAHGVDISAKSIAAALLNKKYLPNPERVTYEVADAREISEAANYSHIVVGAALGFFPDPKIMTSKLSRMLMDGGFLLASPFYTKAEIPEALLKQAYKVFGITPTQIPYKQVMYKFREFELVYEDRNDIMQETEEELDHYCSSTINRYFEENNFQDPILYEACYSRLYTIKEMSNLLRPYQQFSVVIYRYRKSIYPKRFTELF